jgi:hypothetical protein
MKKLATVGVVIAATSSLVACGGTDLRGAPNVKGLALPDAEQQLKQAGYAPSVKTDALFGVIIPEHFSVCDEGSPNGKLVPLTVSKQC